MKPKEFAGLTKYKKGKSPKSWLGLITPAMTGRRAP